MTFADYIDKPASKKITVVEIDTPLQAEAWINYDSGIWFTRLTPTSNTITDDYGNVGYWQGRNDQYYNIQSLYVNGVIYTEVASIALCKASEKTWYYNSTTTDFYIHFEDWQPPEYQQIISLGSALGFTDQVDTTCNNYFEDIYYEPLITAVPNLSKKKDSLFFGILQYQGGSISFDNTGGYFDDFASLDLYGQPIRIKLTFEGLAFSEQLLVYSGKIEDFEHSFTDFNINVADLRKLLSRKLPVNTLDLTTYPDMDSKLDGTPIPIAFGSIINAPAYKVTDTGGTETWVFCDTEFNAVAAGISVVDKDGAAVASAGTETDGTFTSASAEKKLYVTFSVPTVTNGLDIISDILENYENITYNATNYDTTEWTASKADVYDSGIWIGKGNLMSSVDVIEQICIDNNGIFDVLANGKFTFRAYDSTRAVSETYYEDELLEDSKVIYDSDEYITSSKIEYSNDILEKDPQIYTNTSQEADIFARYRQYKETTTKTTLTNAVDSALLSESILEQSNFIYPKLDLVTKTQKIDVRILDNIQYEHKRQNGDIIIADAIFQVLGVTLDLTNYEITTSIKYIKEV